MTTTDLRTMPVPVRPLAPLPIPSAPPSRNLPPICDLAYRFVARVALLNIALPSTEQGGQPYTLDLAESEQIRHAPYPLKVWASHSELGPIEVGELTHLWRPTSEADGRPLPELCAAGTFNLNTPGVPRLVVELAESAAAERPMIPALRLDNDPDGWSVRDLVIGQAPTWPGCMIVPDHAQVDIKLGGRPYLMRRLHDVVRWRSLADAHAEACERGTEFDRLVTAMGVINNATMYADRNDIAVRLLDLADPLTLRELVDRARGIADLLDADEARRADR